MDKSQPTLADLIDLRLDRRGLIRGAAALAAASPFAAVAQEAGPSSLTFKELAHTLDDKQHVADGYDMQVLIRWGDPVMADAPAFNAANQTAAAQEKQFGYNNDYLGLHPLPLPGPGGGSRSNDRFLGSGERGVDSVTRGLDHDPAPRLDRGAEELIVARQRAPHRVRMLLPEPRRRLEVREEKRHRPGGQRCHRAPIPPGTA